jgi:23S rRNA (adenine2503-C2)-methyltransferase
MSTLLGLEREELQTALGAGVPAFRARQIYQALYQQRIADLSQATALPRELREKLQSGWLSSSAEFSSVDGTWRYLLQLDDGKTVETVLMPEENRDTICISSQVGCPVDCRFCLTALMGLERNLSAGEIVGQVLFVAARHGLNPAERQMNVVLMGQGEPMMNLDNVLKATRILCDPEGVGMTERRITVSTSGLIPGMQDMGRAAVRPKLAISLNASHEEQRRQIMPITQKYSLADLIDACHDYPLRTWEHLTFEYVLLGGVNDAAADARRVVKLLAGLRAKVNLIALNPGPGIPYAMPEEQKVDTFREIIHEHIPCFVRKPRGRDIYAACGQLKRMELVKLS